MKCGCYAVAKNDQQEAFEKILSASLARTIDFVKFAEAKNAALLTFCSAWILALTNIALSNKDLPAFTKTSMALSVTMFFAGLIICLSSFLPKTNLSKLSGNHNRLKNMLFFGDVHLMTLSEFITDSSLRYSPSEDNSTTASYISDLSEQIVINSRIAQRKFQLFNRGIVFCALAIVALITPVIAQWAGLAISMLQLVASSID